MALSGFGVSGVPVPAAMLEAEEAIENFELEVNNAVNEKAQSLIARAEQLQELDGLDSRLATVTSKRERHIDINNTTNKKSMYTCV